MKRDVGIHCKGCKERDIGCHGTCQKYIDAVEEAKKRKEKIDKLKKQDHEYLSYSRHRDVILTRKQMNKI